MTFFKINFLEKKKLRNTIRVSTDFRQNQARRSAKPDPGPNCLQRLTADDKIHRRQAKR